MHSILVVSVKCPFWYWTKDGDGIVLNHRVAKNIRGTLTSRRPRKSQHCTVQCLAMRYITTTFVIYELSTCCCLEYSGAKEVKTVWEKVHSPFH